MSTALVALAGAAGAVLRYRIGVAVGVRSFPWATLGVNLVGCFLIAVLLAGPLLSRWPDYVVTALAFGLLGGFTTFSAFGYETFEMLRTDRLGTAAVYVSLSIAGGLVAVAAGYALGRSLT